jgi:hypothetical protein
MNTEPQPSDVPSPSTNDSIGGGVLLTIALQILFIIAVPLLTRGLMSAVSYRGSAVGMPVTLFRWWGIAQWTALIPLCVLQARKGNRMTIYGVLITGGIGLVLNTACSSALR